MKYPSTWNENNNILVKVFEFKNFLESIEFVNKVAPIAEENNHHPDIDIYGYNKVRVKLTTHDKGSKITVKDIKLASEIDKL